MFRKLPWIGFTVLVLSLPVGANPLNPDLSVIGDTRARYSDVDDKVSLSLSEVELALVGPVNPYASAEVYIGVHDGDTFEVEEAKLILARYLPGNLGLTAGRMLLDFGQINTVHPHAFPWVERPIMHREFFGDDGARDTSLRLDWIAPVDAFTLRLTAGALAGNALMGGHSHGEDDEHEDEDLEHAEEGTDPELGFSGRAEAFLEPGRNTALSFGVSVLHGEHDPAEAAKGTWVGLDAKARFDLGPDRILVVNGEGVLGFLDGHEEEPDAEPNGWFVSADLRADKRWNFGGFAESTTERLHDDHSTQRVGGFVGMALMEESTVFRLVGSVTDPEEGDSETSITLQILFGLGPHRPHRY